jgi:hypothetical protein
LSLYIIYAHDVTMNGLLAFLQKPLDIHYFRQNYFQNYIGFTTHIQKTPIQFRFQINTRLLQSCWIIAQHRLFINMLALRQMNVIAHNLDNILHQKPVKSSTPPLFKRSICFYDFAYQYYTYCKHYLQLQTRVAGSQH